MTVRIDAVEISIGRALGKLDSSTSDQITLDEFKRLVI
jgi:hypothetical protein